MKKIDKPKQDNYPGKNIPYNICHEENPYTRVLDPKKDNNNVDESSESKSKK